MAMPKNYTDADFPVGGYQPGGPAIPHDANDEMLAEEFRRRLRIRSAHHFSTNSLGFLLGDWQ